MTLKLCFLLSCLDEPRCPSYLKSRGLDGTSSLVAGCFFTCACVCMWQPFLYDSDSEEKALQFFSCVSIKESSKPHICVYEGSRQDFHPLA